MAKKLLCLLCTLMLGPAFALSKTVLIKNVSLYLPGGKTLNEAYLLVNGAKIARLGLMRDLKPEVVDEEYDLKGHWLYPAFIDAYYPGFQEKQERRPAAEAPAPDPGSELAIDKNVRKPFSERNYYFGRRLADVIKLNRSEMNKAIGSGFAVLQIVPESGIVGGVAVTVSLVSENPREAVLAGEGPLHVIFEPNRAAYPSTASGVLAEFRQLKADALRYQEAKRLWSSDPEGRPEYAPELDFLLPYFKGEERFMLLARHMGEQRLAEVFRRDVGPDTVLVAGSDIWRRPVPGGQEVVLLLGFKPPATSIYALQGDHAKKQAEDVLYPKKLAEWIKANPRIILSAPAKGDYQTLFASLRLLVKAGVPEQLLINGLTANPARLLGISRWTGSLEAGKLASLLAADGPLFGEKTKIRKVWVEGRLTDLAAEPKRGEPPAANLTGRWTLKVQSQMGSFDMNMTLEQEGNNLTGKIVSRMGTMEIQDGFISGKNVGFSFSANIMGQQMEMAFSGTVENRRIEGKLSLGAMGEAQATAIPDTTGGGGEE